MYFHSYVLNNTEHISDGEARPAVGSEGKEGLSCHRNARPSARRARCEVLNGCLKMDLNMAFHTLSWAAELHYLRVTKATRARTTQGQSGFPWRGPAMLHACTSPYFSKHHQSSSGRASRRSARVTESKQNKSDALPSTGSKKDEEMRGDTDWQRCRDGLPRRPSCKRSHRECTQAHTHTHSHLLIALS